MRQEEAIPAPADVGGRRKVVSSMRWAGKGEHLGGLPRAIIFMAAGAFAKVFTSFLNSTHVHNAETLVRLVRSRPPYQPLITVSNHMSTLQDCQTVSPLAFLLTTLLLILLVNGNKKEVLMNFTLLSRLDDPLMWGFKGFPTMNAKLARWVLAAEDICFKNAIYSYLFRLGKCIPIRRGAGIYQEYMNEALDILISGGWLHTFPEGKICQESIPIRRLKWGTASLIVRAPITPIVLPIVHCGFEKVMPEKYKFDRRPFFPLSNKDIKIIIGDPIEFDLQRLKQKAKTVSNELSSRTSGWPDTPQDGLSEGAQRWLYANISDQIRGVMEKLRFFGMTLKKSKV